jgi:carbonic anhydrase/acetyltransferase-like protein (isoleucine patch superfamily)
MGVYAFTWPVLKKYLQADAADEKSSNDFGKNIIPAMLKSGSRLFAYEFSGYWKDVGTIRSLWEANMELLQDYPPLNLYDDPWRILSRNPNEPPHYVDAGAVITNSMVSEGCHIYGTVINSILSNGVTIAKNAVVRDSIIMADSEIGEGSVVDMSIIDEEVRIGKACRLGDYADVTRKIAVIGKKAVVRNGASVGAGEQVAIGATVDKARAVATNGSAANGKKPVDAASGKKAGAVKSEKKAFVVKGGKNAAVVKGGGNATAVKGGKNAAAVKGVGNATAVKGEKNAAAVKGVGNATAVKGGKNAAAVKDGKNAGGGKTGRKASGKEVRS